MNIDIRADLKPLHRAFIALGAKQVPYASALALTRLAEGVQAAEVDELKKDFEKTTAFTERAFGKTAATKKNLVATVFIKDRTSDAGGQNAYLAPYVLGGDRSLGGKRGMLVPRAAKTNQFGNLSKGQLARYKGMPDVFIGPVTFKNGRTVNGVWKRGATKRGARYKGGGEYGTRGKNTNKPGGVRTTLQLLIEFEDTTPVPHGFDFYGRARTYVRANAAREFEAAMRQALATAR